MMADGAHNMLLCTCQQHPPLPHPRIRWGNSGDLTEYHVNNRVAPPLGHYQMSIHLSITIKTIYDANSPCQFHLPSGENSCQFPVNSPVYHRGGVVAGVIDRCIVYNIKIITLILAQLTMDKLARTTHSRINLEHINSSIIVVLLIAT